MSNIFRKPTDEFTKITDYKEEAHKQLANYLVTTRNMSYDKAMSIVIKAEEAKAKNKVNKLITRRITYWERDLVTLDKKPVTTTYEEYHTSAYAKGYTIAPSGTCFTKKQVIPDNKGSLKISNLEPLNSLDSLWTNDNKNARSKIKREAFAAFSKKDMLTFAIKSVGQKGKKLRNNALSGTYSLLFLPHAIGTGHNTLTSTTRISTSVCNIFSEKNVSGSRFYKSYTDVFAEAMFIIDMANEKHVLDTVKHFNLKIPTTEDIEEMIYDGTKFNFINSKEYNSIVKFIKSLSPFQKCAWYYSQSWYNLIKINHELIHGLIDDVVEDGTVDDYTVNDILKIKKADDDIKNMLHTICLETLLDKGTNYDDMLKKQKKENLPDVFPKLVYTFRNIEKFINIITPIVKTFFTDIHALPIGVTDAKSKSMIDLTLSDTDSSCDSFAKISKKAKGADKAIFNKNDIPRSGVFAFLNTACVHGMLTAYGSNMNISKDKFGIIAMESEKLWRAFIPMRVSKHYFNKEIISELNVIDGDIATSGVALINAKAPQKYRDYFDEFKLSIIGGIENHIDVKDMMRKIIAIEDEIENELLTSPQTLLKTDKIKPEHTYKLDWKKSNYYHVKFWEKCFSAKYGKSPEAPLSVVRLPLTADSGNKLKEFLKNNGDDLFTNNVTGMVKEAGKKSGLPSLMLPLENIKEHGVPTELIPIIDKGKVLMGLMKPFYTVLSSIGLSPRKGLTMKETYQHQFQLDV